MEPTSQGANKELAYIMADDVKAALDRSLEEAKKAQDEKDAKELEQLMEERMTSYQRAMAQTFDEIIRGPKNE
jgi:shikimate kinase